jgi:hypothetical protein
MKALNSQRRHFRYPAKSKTTRGVPQHQRRFPPPWSAGREVLIALGFLIEHLAKYCRMQERWAGKIRAFIIFSPIFATSPRHIFFG